MHALIAVLLRVEYQAVIPLKDGNEVVNFTLGWYLHLPTVNAAEELIEGEFSGRMELGPGVSPVGDLLW